MARILIVDDSQLQQVAIKRIVEKLGHETLTAVDGACVADYVRLRFAASKPEDAAEV